MTIRFFSAYILTLAAMCAALTGCPDHTPETGGGGAGGGISPEPDASACNPLQDNDPVACAPNHCTTVADGCGGTIRCDSVCNSEDVPASCGLDSTGAPACFLCTLAVSDDQLCSDTPGKPWAYHCPWQYPQPIACTPKNVSQDRKTYTACCGGPGPM